MPTFCALMANYNDAATIEAALMPLIEQTVPFDRILVVNDGSTDNSMEVLLGLKARFPQLQIHDNERNIGAIASVRYALNELVSEEMKWMSDWFLYALLSTRHGFVYVPEQFGTMIVGPTQYSSAVRDWRKQGPVVRSFFTIMQNEFPDELKNFRTMALLPSYDWQILPMLLADRTLRAYITPMLLWRLSVTIPARTIARAILPRGAFNALRKWARV